MKSRAFIFSCILICIVAMIFKLMSSEFSSVMLDKGHSINQLSSFLEEQSFIVAGRDKFDDFELILAYKSGCEVQATIVSPGGETNSSLESRLRPDSRMYFVFEGAVFSNLPRFPALIAVFEDRLLRAILFKSEFRPVLGVIETGDCELNSADWSRFHTLNF